jgi:flagellar L-ring protein precursor FlgH
MSDLRRLVWIVVALSALHHGAWAGKKGERPAARSPLDRYIEEAMSQAADQSMETSPGSVWSPSARLSDAARDVRASQVDDLVMILVVERASAVAKGSTKSARASSAKSSVSALGGLTRATGPLANLANLSGESQLSGEGTTSRETVLSTTLSARVTHVLPNGFLVVEGFKDVQVNSEQQMVSVRGVVRPEDLSTGNLIRSDHLAQLEVRISGKGVIGDAVRRPSFLYRLLLGLLPF